jgi:hypothetical protein
VGHENTQADWTLVDAYSSIPMVDGQALRLPIVTDMIFEAGSTHGIYVTTTDAGGLRATIGSATGTVLENDGRLTIRSGTGKVYPFGLSYGNRQPNVSIEYDSCPDPTP